MDGWIHVRTDVWMCGCKNVRKGARMHTAESSDVWTRIHDRVIERHIAGG